LFVVLFQPDSGHASTQCDFLPATINRLLSHPLVGCYFQADQPVLRAGRLYIFIADHSRGRSERLYDNVALYVCHYCVRVCVCMRACVCGCKTQLWLDFLYHTIMVFIMLRSRLLSYHDSHEYKFCFVDLILYTLIALTADARRFHWCGWVVGFWALQYKGVLLQWIVFVWSVCLCLFPYLSSCPVWIIKPCGNCWTLIRNYIQACWPTSPVSYIIMYVIHCGSWKKGVAFIFSSNFGKCGPILAKFFYCCIQRWTTKEVGEKLPSHLKSVATLPCEIWVFQLCDCAFILTTVLYSVHIRR